MVTRMPITRSVGAPGARSRTAPGPRAGTQTLSTICRRPKTFTDRDRPAARTVRPRAPVWPASVMATRARRLALPSPYARTDAGRRAAICP